MLALELLLWILAAVGGIVLLTLIAGFILLIWIAWCGFRVMRDDEASQLPGRGES